ncbi:MAG: NUDIX hydrolase [Runella slithyformis]|jgi:8-oxo-dGTP diphosphatase|nr:MAG: NUDIX hydrolase [Runella slithyformis]TAF28990.1 MAG: NUDIX hydrolase [Runella slithyformis]TAF46449.1 MAG: NUDIX hydrolase [Runella slithyformis]TAF82606.1 MAG: NUDIX hydrolase [Runella slithyformis]
MLDLSSYEHQPKCLVALDSIIFGFDGDGLKILLVKRGPDSGIDTWSLMGGWLNPTENLEQAADRILFELTGLNSVYLEQLYAFGDIGRDPIARTVAVSYFALINIEDYDSKISHTYHAHWFPVNQLPDQLLFDHRQMIDLAIEKLRYKAALHPIGFELLPEKFTIPHLQKLYEAIFQTSFDKRNFSRKILSTHLLLKLNEKQKSSKKGAFLYKVDKQKYEAHTHSFLNFVQL